MTETVTIDTSSAAALNSQAQAALYSANDLVIDSPDMYAIAGSELQEIKALQKVVEERRTAITGPLNLALKNVNDLFRAPADYLKQAEAAVKRPMIEWQSEQERLFEVARRAAAAVAAAERLRLDAIAREQRVIAAEAEAQALLAQGWVEVAVANGDEAAAAAAEAVVNSAVEAAYAAQEATISAELVTFAPAVQAPAKVAGIASRVTYTAQVDSLLELVKAVADGRAPIQCLSAETKFLGAQARAFKKTGPLYPGVSVVAERGIAARSA